MSTRGNASGSNVKVRMLWRTLGEGGEQRQQGIKNEREIPVQVYHRLAKRERVG